MSADRSESYGMANENRGSTSSITKPHEMSTKDFMDALPDKMAKHFVDKVDANHDGTVSVHEIAQLFASYEEKEHEVGVMRVELVIALFFLLVSIFANFGTAWAAYDLAQQTETGSNGVMTTRDGEVVKVASTLMEKKPTRTNGEEVTLLTDRDTGKALATETIAKALPTSKLSSEFDDETFDELDALKISNSKGTINFKVLGWARYVNEDSRCGTVVVLYTNPGSIQLDGVDMSFNEGVAGAFSRAGFQVTGRRRGRRAEDPDAQGLLTVAEVLGKFRYLSDKNLDLSQLSCGDDRPTVKGFFHAGKDGKQPADIAYTQTLLQRCDSGFRKGGCPAAPLTVEFMGKSYYRRTLSTRAKYNYDKKKYFSISRMEFPEIPGGNALVIVSDGEKQTRFSVGPSYENQAQYCITTKPQRQGAAISDVEFPEDAGVEEKIDNDDYASRPTAETKFEGEDFERTDTAATITYNPVDSVVVKFLGYNVLNNVYVRHFSLTTEGVNKTVATVDYYEHFDERRMYAVPLAPESSINTFETVTQDPSADLLQDEDYYPDFDNTDSFLAKPCAVDRNETTNLFVDGYKPRTDLKDYVGELYVKEKDDAAVALELSDEAAARVTYFTQHPNTTTAMDARRAVQVGGKRKRRVSMQDIIDGCVGQSLQACLMEDPTEDECVMPFPIRHQCLQYSTSFIGGICDFTAMLCAPFYSNVAYRPAAYANLRVECSYTWNIGGGATLEAGGYLEIGMAAYPSNSMVRVRAARGGPKCTDMGNQECWATNFSPLGYSRYTNPCRGDPELYIEGGIWIEFRFSFLGLNCYVRGEMSVRFDVIAREISHTLGLSGGCGAISLSIEATLVWSPPNYPKTPHGAELGVSGSLGVNECTRICIPLASCGWTGCRSWNSCHNTCISFSISGSLGPWNLR